MSTNFRPFQNRLLLELNLKNGKTTGMKNTALETFTSNQSWAFLNVEKFSAGSMLSGIWHMLIPH